LPLFVLLLLLVVVVLSLDGVPDADADANADAAIADENEDVTASFETFVLIVLEGTVAAFVALVDRTMVCLSLYLIDALVLLLLLLL
jgi:hypothetical protein